MNDLPPKTEYDGKGDYYPVTVSINDSIGAVALAVVAAFLSVGIVRLARHNADLSARLAQLEDQT